MSRTTRTPSARSAARLASRRFLGRIGSGAALVMAVAAFAPSANAIAGETPPAKGDTTPPTPMPTVSPGRAPSDRATLSDAECPRDLGCAVAPAAYQQTDPTSYGNYDLADRPSDGLAVRSIVIHDTELAYDKTLALFQNPAARASANYVVRSFDGQVTQMVPNRDVAWHSGNWWVNSHAIGIELEGFATEGNAWYTDRTYRSLAKLIRYLAARYDIPIDRGHIIGHDEVPGPIASYQAGMHWDPGPYFDWSRLMRAVSRKRAPAVPRATTRGAVTITPNYQRNRPPVSSCDSSGCQPLPSQPTNFVYLRSAPSATAPLVADPLLRDTALEPGGVGSERADDWGDKAVTGQSFAVADRRGPWTAIWYGGQKAWLYDRNGMSTTPACTRLVTPNAGRDSIPVYGRAYPQAVSTDTLGYSIGAGQRYVAEALVPADYYSARTFNQPETYKVITDETSFYEISFNHRRAFVSASDVTVVGPDCSRDVDAAARPATQSDTASSELQYLG